MSLLSKFVGCDDALYVDNEKEKRKLIFIYLPYKQCLEINPIFQEL